MAGVGGIQATGTGVGKQWYTFPWTNDYGGFEPFGNFPKPDINVQVPDNYPITALRSGIVTNIDSSSPWGCAVTIRLDQPLNSIATHTAYLHLSGVPTQVRAGSHVNAGDIIGYNGGGSACGSQKVPVGFALYNGDQYGYGSTWSQYVGNSQLNPSGLLSLFSSGKQTLPPSSNGASISKNTGTLDCGPFGLGCLWTNIQQAFVSWGEHIAIFVIALVLIIIGFLLLSEKTAAQVMSKVPGVV